MKKYIISFLCVFIIFLGCTKKDEIKPSRDALLTTEVINTMDAINTAYEEKNKNVLQNHVGTLLLKDIVHNLSFDRVELDFSPRMVKLGDASIKVHLNWKARWSLANEKVVNDRGVAYFIFHKETMKLSYIEGDNPFSIPSSIRE
jgi:hypothetical protein